MILLLHLRQRIALKVRQYFSKREQPLSFHRNFHLSNFQTSRRIGGRKLELYREKSVIRNSQTILSTLSLEMDNGLVPPA